MVVGGIGERGRLVGERGGVGEREELRSGVEGSRAVVVVVGGWEVLLVRD